MSDLSFLQYVLNPYSALAVIAIVIGTSLRMWLKDEKKPKLGFVLTMYAMYLGAVIFLGMSVVAVSFLMSGHGATEQGVGMLEQNRIFSLASFLPAEALAKVGESLASSASFIQKAQAHHPLAGWIWAGEVQDETLDSSTIFIGTDDRIIGNYKGMYDEPILSIATIPLRSLPPKFSWRWFQYVLGEEIWEIPKGTKMIVHRHKYAGPQLWLQVEVIHEE